MVPDNLPVWILLPNSQGLFWWDAMIRWLAVAFFIQIPIDIAFNMQQRLTHWYYITIQVSSACHLACLPWQCSLTTWFWTTHSLKVRRTATCASSLVTTQAA